jgi:TetR/AcrR family transcriptional repressor of lmrAB and yxaGH operons
MLALGELPRELPALDADLTQRVAPGFQDSTELVAGHFRGCGCGYSPARGLRRSGAVAAVEGARTVARLERSPAVFEALAVGACASLTPMQTLD